MRGDTVTASTHSVVAVTSASLSYIIHVWSVVLYLFEVIQTRMRIESAGTAWQPVT